MPIYNAPLENIRFILNDVLDAQTTLAQLPGFESADAGTVDAVMEGAERHRAGGGRDLHEEQLVEPDQAAGAAVGSDGPAQVMPRSGSLRQTRQDKTDSKDRP